MSKNILNLSVDQSVSICVQTNQYPGDYDLWVYNSAGEQVKVLDSQYLSAPLSRSYSWDGKNKFGESCASGVYIFYLVEPYACKVKRMLLVR